ncbi:glutathione S-transferase-like isoform X1 [Telopea speciosissima]|uniref:glutathione S-transferase-like isoform X1 n=1 Tax=Telopea speciosissima TaxID=54955 RepID=UPI001CC45591|nr:glutathione S-transferase-like isoform X1 [Telopea speciosissima]
MAPKVHAALYSTAAMRAFATLHEKNVEFEVVPIDMRAGEHKKEPFLSLNPFGKVPAFEDGDLKLFESRAITAYVAYEYHGKGTELVYHDTKKMATVSVWIEVEAHHFDPVVSKLVTEQLVKPMLRGLEPDSAVVEENQKKLGEVLDVYEARLSKSKYLGGDEFTLADLHHLPAIHYMMGTSTKKVFETRPHVSAWAKDILARPAWIKTVAMQKQA